MYDFLGHFSAISRNHLALNRFKHGQVDIANTLPQTADGLIYTDLPPPGGGF
jgi:hypothetical protein